MFAGIRDRVIAEAASPSVNHAHVIRIVEYKFPDCTELYVEVSEPGRGPDARLIALSDAVHALLNLGEDELYLVGGRE